ncbi:MAG TPA: hypothetical protein VIX73_23100 [Kofleriaceae bacterium]|jgi:hypothetical protein
MTKMKNKRRPSPPAAEPTPPLESSPEPAATDELHAAAAQFAQEFPDAAPPPPPPPPPGSAPTGGEEDDAGELVEDLAEDLGEHVDVAADLSPEEIGEFFELVFDLIAEKRGEHWRLPERSAQRLGRWGHRVLERHPELLGWLAKNLPELVFGVLLAVEVATRWQIDRKKRAAIAPADQ